MRCSPSFVRRFFLTLIALSACSPDRDAASPIVGDSAGIALVDYPGRFEAASQRRSSTSGEPLFVVGGPSLPLHLIVGPVFQSDGGFVVGNAGFHELLFMDADGRLKARSGRQGEGPGEFRRMTLLSVGTADSIVAFDASQRRASIFDPSGAFVRDVPMQNLGPPTSPVPLPPTIVTYAGLLGAGRMAVALQQRTAGTGLVRDSLAVVAFSPESGRFDAIATFPSDWKHWGPHRLPGLHGSDEVVTFPLPLPFSGLTAVGALGDSLYVATADGFSLSLLTPNGIRRITRERQPPDRITDAHREALFAQLSESMRNNPETEFLFSLPGPETLPAFGRGPLTARTGEGPIVVTDVGEVWLQPFSVGDSIDTSWPRFDAAGVYQGVVVVPAGFRATAVRGDLVLGVYTDASGVQYVHAYRFGGES